MGQRTGINSASLFYPNPQSVAVLLFDNNGLTPIGSVLQGSTHDQKLLLELSMASWRHLGDSQSLPWMAWLIFIPIISPV